MSSLTHSPVVRGCPSGPPGTGRPFGQAVIRVSSLIVLILGAVACTAPLPYTERPLANHDATTALAARRLDDAGLRDFLSAAGAAAPAPGQPWQFESLALVAGWFSEDVAAARVRWQSALEQRQRGLLVKGMMVSGGLERHSLQEAPRSNPWTLGLGLEFTLPSPLRKAARGAQLDAEVGLANVQLAQAFWDARQRVREAWLLNGAAAARLAVQQGLQVLLDERSHRVDIRVRHGEAADAELAAARNAASAARAALAAGERDVVAAQRALLAAIGLPEGHARLELPPAYPDPAAAADPALLPQAERAALDNRLDLHAAQARFIAADADLRWAVAEQYPEISLNPGYEFDQGDHRLRIGVALPFRLPEAHQAQVGAALAEREARAREVLARQEAVIHEVFLRQRAVQDASAALAAAAERCALAGKEYERADRALALGAIDPVQRLDAAVALQETELMRVSAGLALTRALEDLEDTIQQPFALLLDTAAGARGAQPSSGAPAAGRPALQSAVSAGGGHSRERRS